MTETENMDGFTCPMCGMSLNRWWYIDHVRSYHENRIWEG